MARSEAFLGDPAVAGFRAARKVGRRGLGSLPLAIVVVGIGSLIVYGQIDGPLSTTWFPVVWAIVAAAILLVRVVAIARSWSLWARAERGEPTLTFEGQAVAQQRTVSRRLMRTVVVRQHGIARYVHLLFAEDAAAVRIRAGHVTLDLFGGAKIQGPARLTAPGGVVVWAFTAKAGKTADLPAPTPPAPRATDSDPSFAAGGAMWVPAGLALNDEQRDDDGWSGGDSSPSDLGDGWTGDGWTGGSSWGSDSSWSGSSGSDGGSSWGGEGWSSGGDSAGGSSGD